MTIWPDSNFGPINPILNIQVLGWVWTEELKPNQNSSQSRAQADLTIIHTHAHAHSLTVSHAHITIQHTYHNLTQAHIKYPHSHTSQTLTHDSPTHHSSHITRFTKPNHKSQTLSQPTSNKPNTINVNQTAWICRAAAIARLLQSANTISSSAHHRVHSCTRLASHHQQLAVHWLAASCRATTNRPPQNWQPRTRLRRDQVGLESIVLWIILTWAS